MKKLLVLCSLAVMLVGFTAFNAAAVEINGAISFSGTAVYTETAFTGFSEAVVSGTGGTGDYAPVVAGTEVAFNNFQFLPTLAPSPVVLWTFSIADDIYSFLATGITEFTLLTNTVAMGGPGVASITGFEDTPGIWSLTANQAGGTASFSSSAIVAPVPEPATMLLLGFGLVGLVGIRRKFYN